jgi:hypothetical protein
MLGATQSLAWFGCWLIVLATSEHGGEEATDWLKPPAWSGNFWGPAANRARMSGQLPPLPMTPAMAPWCEWGQRTLQEGDIVFRMGDARAFRGMFPLSLFIAKATGSPFSHTGIVAIENGSAVVYDCSADGIQRQPFEVWMLDCVGSLGVKRLKPEYRSQIPGVISFCRQVFEQQVPFDPAFSMDDGALYCLELTEKAFRSQRLLLSKPVRIGDWEHLNHYPLSALTMPYFTRLVVGRPITLDQLVYVPGNDHEGVWASPLLMTVFGPDPKGDGSAAPGRRGGISLRGDLELIVCVLREMRRSYSERPVQWICDLTLPDRFRRLSAARDRDERQAGLKDSRTGSGKEVVSRGTGRDAVAAP